MTSRRLLAVVATTAATILAGCGGDDGKKTGDAKTLEPNQTKGAKGNVSLCIGKDTSGAFGKAIAAHNKANPAVRAKLVELPESADEQRTQQIQRLRAKSAECDVLGTDVVWTAEYAAQGWLRDVTPVVEARKSEFIASTLETTKYEGKYWALPFNTNAGFVYYRKDQSPQAPKTWEKLYQEAKSGNGVVYQGARYEGLTVSFLELLYSGGGKVLSDDGKTVEVDSAAARKALKFMADGVKNGSTPKAVTTYKEEEARRAFESGDATFMRNWPYAYTLGKESKIGTKFDIAPFPSFGGAEGAGVIGGYNLAISAFSKRPEAALEFVQFMTRSQAQRLSGQATLPPTLKSSYDDPAVKKAMPFAAQLRTSIEGAKPRPVTPVYPQVTQAVYENVHDALTGKVQSEQAITKMKSEIEKALETF